MCNAHEGAIEQGKEIRNFEIARKMILKGARYEDIIELTELSYDDVDELFNTIKQG